MGYQALLFCPDEKLARVVSQVFTELDFTVDPVHEPFAAVKKLMAQRFDAIVVDCENEQNASLLFKSARNSGSNQSSLAIALVEGQAGVAKAYRIGANLVLTKPINVEQAKGTLRVARGLLRKNSDAASAAAVGTATQPLPAKSQLTSSGASSQSFSEPTPAPIHDPGRAPLSFAASAPSVPSVTPVGYSQHTDSAKNEFEDQPLAIGSDATPAQISQTPTMSASTASVEIAGIAEIKSQIELENSFPNKSTTENNAAKSVEQSPASFSTAPPGSNASSSSSSSTSSSTGSAAAVAHAKEVAAAPVQNLVPVPVKESASAPSTAPLQPVSNASGFVFDAAPTSDAPSFGTLSGEEDSGGSGSNKKMLIAAAAVLAIAALGYVGYTKMSGGSTAPVTQPISASQNFGQPPSAPPTSSSQSTTLSTTAPATPNSAGRATVPATVPATATSRIAVNASPEKIAVGSGTPPTIHIGVETGAKGTPGIGSVAAAPTKKPASIPIQVKSSDGTAGQSSSDDSAPSLAASSAAGPGNNSLSSVMSSTSSALPIPTLATVRVSQGVSQGLVIKRVQPKYPQAALAAHTTGVVQIEATVSKDGTVTNAKVLSGDPVLARAALEAVRQWRYKPYYLDGAPVEIQTQISVNFKAN